MTNLWLNSARRRKNPSNKRRNEKGEISTDTAEIKKKRIWRIICQQIWQCRRNGQFSRVIQPTKLNQEEIHQLNWLITWSETDYVVKTLPTNRSPGLDGLTGEFYHTYKELIPILLELFLWRRKTPKDILRSHYE